jgi:hypothetical protein
MARRRLLTGDERRRLFDPPVQETAIIGHYTLSAEDVELVGRRYGPANRLGLAAQIALMRHPGFGLQPEIGLPDVILRTSRHSYSSILPPSLHMVSARKPVPIMPISWRVILAYARFDAATWHLP